MIGISRGLSGDLEGRHDLRRTSRSPRRSARSRAALLRHAGRPREPGRRPRGVLRAAGARAPPCRALRRRGLRALAGERARRRALLDGRLGRRARAGRRADRRLRCRNAELHGQPMPRLAGGDQARARRLGRRPGRRRARARSRPGPPRTRRCSTRCWRSPRGPRSSPARRTAGRRWRTSCWRCGARTSTPIPHRRGASTWPSPSTRSGVRASWSARQGPSSSGPSGSRPSSRSSATTRSRAADRFRQIGSQPDQALARLRAAQILYGDGRAPEAHEELTRALAFHRRVDATTYLREAELLVGATQVQGTQTS